METTMTRLLASGLLLVLATLPAQDARADDPFGASLEELTGIPREAAQPLSAAEMDDLRGGFLGLFFSVEFRGFVQPGGVLDARLDVNAGLQDASGTQTGDLSFGSGAGGSTGGAVAPGAVGGAPVATVTNPATGETFRVAAIINGGSFQGSNMVAQITQVPGNMNDIRQALVLNLAIIQAREQDFDAVRSQLAPLFGF
jgi:hypothetical protein